MNQFVPKILWENNHGKKKLYSFISENNKTKNRIWNPYHSKLAAALFNGLEIFPFKSDSKILYYEKLQSSTLNHLNDIVKISGKIYAVKNSFDVIKSKTNITYIEPKNFDITNNIFQKENFDIIYFDIMDNHDLQTKILNYKNNIKNLGFLILIINYSNPVEISKSKQSLSSSWDVKSTKEKQKIFQRMGIPLNSDELEKLNSLKFVELSTVWKDNITLDNNSTMNDFSFKNQINSILNKNVNILCYDCKLSKKEIKINKQIIYDYLLKRKNLYCALMLIDIRLDPQKKDLDLIHWMGLNEISFVAAVKIILSNGICSFQPKLPSANLVTIFVNFNLLNLSSALLNKTFILSIV